MGRGTDAIAKLAALWFAYGVHHYGYKALERTQQNEAAADWIDICIKQKEEELTELNKKVALKKLELGEEAKEFEDEERTYWSKQKSEKKQVLLKSIEDRIEEIGADVAPIDYILHELACIGNAHGELKLFAMEEFRLHTEALDDHNERLIALGKNSPPGAAHKMIHADQQKDIDKLNERIAQLDRWTSDLRVDIDNMRMDFNSECRSVAEHLLANRVRVQGTERHLKEHGETMDGFDSSQDDLWQVVRKLAVGIYNNKGEPFTSIRDIVQTCDGYLDSAETAATKEA